MEKFLLTLFMVFAMVFPAFANEEERVKDCTIYKKAL